MFVRRVISIAFLVTVVFGPTKRAQAWDIERVGQFGTAAPGDLLWENRGQQEPRGLALAVAVQGNVVVATGDVAGDWFVRAHDARTGVTLWEDRVGAPQAFDRAQEVAVDAGRVF